VHDRRISNTDQVVSDRPDNRDDVAESLNEARHIRWISQLNFTQSSRKRLAPIRRLGAALRHPKSTKPSAKAMKNKIF